VLKSGVPKVVDVAQRRRELAEAMWRVVRRDGLDRASVRNVAREAGLSMGSLRHYFASQSELMAFALRVVIDRVGARIRALGAVPSDPRQRAALILDQLLPMDPERSAENEVWLAFTARAMVDPQLSDLHRECYDHLRKVCRSVVDALATTVRGRVDVDLEADRLHALIDGLAVHAATHPDRNPPERMRAIVDRHLDDLLA
jgi:AcrR family transcriptional regulator